MSTGAVIAIVVVIVVVIGALAVGALEMRRRRLRRQFGPEYDRVVSETGNRRKAEAELAGRQRRVAKLDIRPLTAEENAQYLGEWNAIQERFVDTPTESVNKAGTLVTKVMRVRGYPAEDHDEAMDALSVDYAPTLARYREARATSERAGSGTATTDDLRQAMLQYRELFYELVDVPADERVGGTTAARDAEVAQATKRTEPADEVPARTRFRRTRFRWPKLRPSPPLPPTVMRWPLRPPRLSVQREDELMPRDQETSYRNDPTASDDPLFREPSDRFRDGQVPSDQDQGDRDLADPNDTGATPIGDELAGRHAGPADADEVTPANGTASGPVTDTPGEWVAGAKGPDYASGADTDTGTRVGTDTGTRVGSDTGTRVGSDCDPVGQTPTPRSAPMSGTATTPTPRSTPTPWSRRPPPPQPQASPRPQKAPRPQRAPSPHRPREPRQRPGPPSPPRTQQLRPRLLRTPRSPRGAQQP